MSIITDIEVGDVFKHQGKKYAYVSQTARGLIISYRLPSKVLVKWGGSFTVDRMRKGLTGEKMPELQEAYIESMNNKANKKQEGINKMKSMIAGQKFKGINGRKYVFTSYKQTRFSFYEESTSTQFTARGAFIKEVLQEFVGTKQAIVLDCSGKNPRLVNTNRPEGSEHCLNCWQLHMPDEFGKDELCNDCQEKTGHRRFSEL